MIKNIITWGNKSKYNIGLLSMIIMLILEAILELPVLIPSIKHYGWTNQLPTRYIIYFTSTIFVSFWVTFEIINKLFLKKNNGQ